MWEMDRDANSAMVIRGGSVRLLGYSLKYYFKFNIYMAELLR